VGRIEKPYANGDPGVARRKPAKVSGFDHLLKHAQFCDTGFSLLAGNEDAIINTARNAQETLQRQLSLCKRH